MSAVQQLGPPQLGAVELWSEQLVHHYPIQSVEQALLDLPNHLGSLRRDSLHPSRKARQHLGLQTPEREWAAAVAVEQLEQAQAEQQAPPLVPGQPDLADTKLLV